MKVVCSVCGHKIALQPHCSLGCDWRHVRPIDEFKSLVCSQCASKGIDCLLPTPTPEVLEWIEKRKKAGQSK